MKVTWIRILEDAQACSRQNAGAQAEGVRTEAPVAPRDPRAERWRASILLGHTDRCASQVGLYSVAAFQPLDPG